MQHIGTFRAKRQNGETVILHVFQDFHEAGSRAGRNRIPGLKNLETDDGEHVNYLEQGKFEIVDTGEVLTSDDPNCPPYGERSA